MALEWLERYKLSEYGMQIYRDFGLSFRRCVRILVTYAIQ